MIIERPRMDFSSGAVGGERASAGEIFDSMRTTMRYAENSSSRGISLIESYDHFIKPLSETTGEKIDNPMRADLDSMPGADQRTARHEAEFFKRLDKIGERYPEARDKLFTAQDVRNYAEGLARQAEGRYQRTMARSEGGLTDWGAWLAGGFVGSLEDPVNVATALAFGPFSPAGAGVKGLLWQGVKAGVANASAEAVIQPSVQAWRAKAGLPHGLDIAALNTAGAGLFGFGLDVGARSATRGIRRLAGRPYLGADVDALRKAVRRRGASPDVILRLAGRRFRPADPGASPVEALEAAANEAQDGSLLRRAQDGDSAALRELAETTGATENASVRGALAADEANEALGQVRPGGVSEAEHMERIGQAIEALVSEAPPPGNAAQAPATARGEAGARLANDAEPPKTGSTIEIEGKPVVYRSLDPQTIEADPDVFQFKSGGDAYGVTGRLRGVRRWDALSSSKAVIFERADGQMIIADGHQRLGLAKRLIADPRAEGETPTIDSFVFREADGWTAADVSAYAAAKNMREQSGSSLDMAKVIRARPDLVDDSMPLTDRKMKEAVALSKLEDSAFDMVVSGVVPSHYGALVGDRVADPSRHTGLLRDMLDAGAQNEQQARLTLGQLMAVPTKTETQETLFGSETFTRSLMPERVRVLDSALKELRRDRRVFNVLEAEARRIEGEGNVLARDANVRQAEAAAKLAELIESLSTRTGMVSDLLNEAAKSVANGVRTTTAAKGLVSKLSDVLEREGLAGLDRRLREAPESERIDDPAGPDAQAQTDRLDPMFSLRDEGETAPLRGVHSTTSRLDFERFDDAMMGLGDIGFYGTGIYMHPEGSPDFQKSMGVFWGNVYFEGARNIPLVVEAKRPFVIDIGPGQEVGEVTGNWDALKPHGWEHDGPPIAVSWQRTREKMRSGVQDQGDVDPEAAAQAQRELMAALENVHDIQEEAFQKFGEMPGDARALRDMIERGDIPDNAESRDLLARLTEADQDVIQKRVARNRQRIDYQDAQRFTEAVRAAGYDAIVVQNNGTPFETVAIEPGTVRSALTGDPMFALRAFHASPHRFDRFDISRIGTGEGNQAFSHGLYFAQHPNVMLWYDDMFGRERGSITVDGEAYDATKPSHLAARHLRQQGGRRADAIDKLEREESAARTRGQEDVAGRARAAADFLRNAADDDLPEYETGAHTYEVILHVNEEDLLDWDGYLRDQSQAVQAGIARVFENLEVPVVPPIRMIEVEPGRARVEWGDNFENSSRGLILTELAEEWVQRNNERGTFVPFIYDRLVEKTGSPQAASEALREAGVPGVKYLDADSRLHGDGTRNIVMFSDDPIEIVRRDGKRVTGTERDEIMASLGSRPLSFRPGRAAAPTPRLQEAMPEIRKEIDKAISRILGPEQKRVVRERLTFGDLPERLRPVGQAISREIEGLYDPYEQIVYVSLNALDPVAVAREESGHALRALGLLPEADYQRLAAEAGRLGLREEFEIDARYGAGRVAGQPYDATNPQHLAMRHLREAQTRERAIDRLEMEASAAASRGQNDMANLAREAAEFLRAATDDELPEYRPGLYGRRYGGNEARLEAALQEETIMQMIAERNSGRSFGRSLNAIMDRIIKFLRAVRDALGIKGFRTVQDVLEDVESGVFARRQQAAEIEQADNLASAGEALFALGGPDPARMRANIEQLLRDNNAGPDLTQDVLDEFDKLVRAYDDEGRAATETAKRLSEAAKLKKRQDLLQEQKRQEIERVFLEFRDARGQPDPAFAMRALLEHHGKVDNLPRGMISVDGHRKALLAQMHREMDEAVERFRTHPITGAPRDKAGQMNVVREIFGDDTGDQSAKLIARAWSDLSENWRQRFNANGGNIGKLESWHIPQPLDMEAMLRASEDEFVNDALANLDMSKMVHPLSRTPMTRPDVEKMLRWIYKDRTSDGWAHADATAQRFGLGKIANQRGDHRVLHWKDAKAWRTMQEKYGNGKQPHSIMMDHLERLARDLAPMEVMGPNPEATMAWMENFVIQQAALARAGQPAVFPRRLELAGREFADPRVYAKQMTDGTRDMWRVYRGSISAPVNKFWAHGLQTARNLEVASKLGSAFISAIADFGLQVQTRYYNDLPITGTVRDIVTAVKGNRRLAAEMGVMVEGFLDRLDGDTRGLYTVRGAHWSRWFADRVISASFLKAFTNASQLATMIAFQRHMAGLAGKSFADLPQGSRNVLGRYGLDEGDWDRLRAALRPDPNGRPGRFLRPSDISAAGDDRLAERYAAMLMQEAQFGSPTGMLRQRALIVGKTQPGTLWGETARSMAQFKGFAVMVALQQERILRRFLTEGFARGASYAAVVAVSMAVFGGLSMQLRELAFGRDPRDMRDPKFWGAAILQAGGLGIWGDFLFSDENRVMGSTLNTLAGPLAGTAVDAIALGQSIASGTAFGEETNTGRQLSQIIRHNTPGSSLWYLRLAADRLVFDELQQQLDPEAYKSFRRKAQWRRREIGNRFYWRPGRPSPGRAPDIGAALGAR